jgi:tetratricopeptide (TPR) repeat protein
VAWGQFELQTEITRKLTNFLDSKSQLAVEYGYRARDRSRTTWIFWIHASNAARFKQSFQGIADRVKISGRRDPQTDVLKLVHDWLCDSRKRWILILDNVDDSGYLFEDQPRSVDQASTSTSVPSRLIDYLPQAENGAVLVTTRNKEAALRLVEPCNIIDIEPMNEMEAKELLKKRMGMKDDSNDVSIGELAETLECIPLALVQAAAYICRRTPRYTIRQYIDDFSRSERKRTSLLKYEQGQLRRDKEAKNSIIITWQISFTYIRSKRPSAADVLSLMSFFDPQGIPEDLIRNSSGQTNLWEDGTKHDKQEEEGNDNDNMSQSDANEQFEKDVETLRDFSFISIKNQNADFEMHKLVQLATRKWLEADGQLEKWRQQFVKNLCEGLPTGEYENWERCQALFPHVKAAADRPPEELAALKDWASIMYKAAWYAEMTGNGADAEQMSEQSMRVRREILGVEHEDTLWSIALVADAYSLTGRWDDAKKLRLQVMEIRKKKLGADHPSTLTSIANLASTYSNQGRWEAAEELFVQVMETSKKKLGADHPSTLTSMANLASTYRNQGRWEAAEELEVQVMETSKKKLGADHPSTLTSMANLASTFWNQGRWEAAEELFVQVM